MSEQQRVRRRPPNDIEAAAPPAAAAAAAQATPQLQAQQASLQAAQRGKWRRLGTLGFVLMMLSLCSIAVLVYVEHWGLGILDLHNEPQSSVSDLPPFFDDKVVPSMMWQYVKLHRNSVANPHDKTSKFLLYEIRTGPSLLFSDSFLGLTSAFLLAMLTDRALLVSWRHEDASQAGLLDSHAVSGIGSQAHIRDVLQDPSFEWDYLRFMAKLQSDRAYTSDPARWVPYTVPARGYHEQFTCEDLAVAFEDKKVLRIATLEYFVPLLTVNPFYSARLAAQFGRQPFAALFNFLVRPVPNIFASIRKFKERYFTGYRVVSMHMQLHEYGADELSLSPEHQQLFFDTAARAVNDAAQAAGRDPDSGIMLFVVTDDQPTLLQEIQQLGHTAFGAAGVVAITSMLSPMLNPDTQDHVADVAQHRSLPFRELLGNDQRLDPTSFLAQVHTELQQLWLLGEAHTIITTPGATFGVVAHARVGLAPTVVIDEQLVHESTSSQPCLANFGVVQSVQCFRPSMLSLVSQDPLVPC